jgi:hypothetical protein
MSPPSNEPELVPNNGYGDEPEPLAGNALLERLHVELDGVDVATLKSARGARGKVTFRYAWCQPLSRFLDFLKQHVKLSAATSYHDSVKYLICRIELDGNGKLEVRQGKHRIDLIDVEGRWHEVKTHEVKHHGELAKIVRHFVRQVQRDTAGREVWWLGFLRGCKGIKARPCSTFLGLLQVHAEVARAATRKADLDALVKEIVTMAEETESKVIDEEDIDDDELEEGFLFGVENQVTKSLRKDVIAKNKEIKQLKLAAREKDADNQRLRAEIERLKYS